MKDNLLPFINSSVKFGLIAITFLIPIFFLSTFIDFFEFPKQLLLVLGTAILVILWLTKFILEKEVRITKTPLDLPIFILLIIYAVSTYFSTSPYTSIVGFFSRLHLSLVSFICYTLLYYIAASNLKNVKEVLQVATSFVASSVILAVLGILYYFGVYALHWTPSNFKNFTPAGSSTALTLTLSLAVPLLLGKLMYVVQTSRKILLTVLIILITTPLVLINFTAAWVALAVSVVVMLLFSYSQNLKHNRDYIFGIILALAVISLLNYLPFSRDVLTFLKVDYQKEQQLDLQSSWAVATSTVRDYPLLGSGPSTFLYDFTKYRPTTYNLSDLWNERFIVSNNDYLQILTTLGIIGFIAYAFFVLKLALFALHKSLKGKETEEHPLKVGLTAGAIGFLAASMFSASTTSVYAIFIILLGSLMALEKAVDKTWVSDFKLSLKMSKAGSIDESKEIMPFLITIPGILLSVIFLFFVYKTAVADFYYKKSIVAASQNNGNDTLRFQAQSIQNNPNQDVYHLALAQTSLAIANNLATKSNPTDQEKQLITSLLNQSVTEARTATTVNPLNVNNWEGLANIYRSIAGAVQGAGNWSLDSFQKAVSIDPPNPQLRLDIGGIFYAAKQYDSAIQLFQQAVSLKPNLANAHYNLANAFKQAGKFNEAYAEYQTTLTLVPANGDDHKKVTSEMNEIKDKVTTTNNSTQTTPAQQPAASSSSKTAK